MPPLPSRSSGFVATVKSSLPKNLHFFCLVSSIVVWATLTALAAGPPTGENAYCGKGNVAQFGAKDGIAELPKACYYTGLDGTPSPGKQIRVPAKSNLATAIDDAKCGDTLLLPAGASFDATELPSKNCDEKMRRPALHHGANRHGRLETSPRRHPHLASMGRSRQPSRSSTLCSTLRWTGQVARDCGCAAP